MPHIGPEFRHTVLALFLEALMLFYTLDFAPFPIYKAKLGQRITKKETGYRKYNMKGICP